MLAELSSASDKEGGEISPLKHKSIVRQAVERLLSMTAWGHSKHADKAKNGGKPCLEKIYSRSTLKNYLAVARQFANWAREKHGCREIDQATVYTGEYLKERMEAGYSAWTVRRDAAALGKLYQKPTTDLGAVLPVRHRGDVTQHSTGASHGHFSEKKHKDLVDFCKATGLRRKEVAALKPADVFQRGGETFVHVLQGKCGKERTVRAWNDTPYQIAQRAADESCPLVFEHIPKTAPIHAYRRDFAKALYARIARDTSTLPKQELYCCMADMSGVVFDRRAMKTVSVARGHSRLDVVTTY